MSTWCVIKESAGEDEEEERRGSVPRGLPGGTDTYIDMPRSDLPSTNTNLLEKPIVDKKVKRHSIHGMMEEENVIRPHQEMAQLSLDEKKFLLAVERGDVASTRRMLQRAQETSYININCVDPLGRSALLMAIDNENLEMVELLIEHKVETKDALLHAISEEFVEAVEVLLDHEETIHKPGEPHSWEALPPDTATFTPDITPLILAAHRDNYEIIKILLDRGATLPMPHDVRCGCDECVTSRMEDSLRHSRSRINAYRALASPSLIALSSKDPILTAFELSWELRRLSFMEHEFKTEYQELRKQCQDFATALLDHTRSSYELEVLLNHDPTGPAFEHGERMHLNRLKLAIKLRQKKEKPLRVPLKIVHLSDIHYSPDYQIGSNAACEEPLCCQNGTSPSNKENGAGYWGDYRNCDTPWRILVESISQIIINHNNIDYIYFTGDIVDHKVWDTSVERNTRSIVEVLNLLKATFKKIPIFPILGNHETHPINVFSPTEITGKLSTQWVFDLMKNEWRKWLPDDVQGTILKGGYYTVLVKPGFRIVALNSNVCYTFNWWLLYDDVDPYDQLKWLVLVLSKAENNDERVHILSHIPSADSTCLQNWAREFSKIILRFSHIITAQFNGHTHAKENIIYYEGKDLTKPVNIAFNGGSLTPYSNFNPNYVIYDVNRKTHVTDYELWIYDIAESNLQPSQLPRWFKLYSFKNAYRVTRISPLHMSNLVFNMTKDCDLANQYFRFKYRNAEVSTRKGCNRDCVSENVCYMVTSYYKHLDQCNLLKDSIEANYNCK